MYNRVMENNTARYAIKAKSGQFFAGFDKDRQAIYVNDLADAVTWRSRHEAEGQSLLLLRFGAAMQRKAVEVVGA